MGQLLVALPWLRCAANRFVRVAAIAVLALTPPSRVKSYLADQPCDACAFSDHEIQDPVPGIQRNWRKMPLELA